MRVQAEIDALPTVAAPAGVPGITDLFRSRRPFDTVCRMAGHSVAVLHQIYARVISSLEAAAHERIDRALSWTEFGGHPAGGQPPTTGASQTEPDTA